MDLIMVNLMPALKKVFAAYKIGFLLSVFDEAHCNRSHE